MNTKTPEEKLDDIMEDLMVGHNFDYARGALLELLRESVIEGRQQVIDRAKTLVSYHHERCHLHDKYVSRCNGCTRAQAALAAADRMHYQLDDWEYRESTNKEES